MSEIKTAASALEALRTSNPRDFEAVLTAAVRQLVLESIEQIEAKQRQRQRATAADTQRLLSHYHDLKDAHTEAVYNLKTLPCREDEHYAEIDDMMRRIISKYDVRLESIEKSAAKTHMYILEIDSALEAYKSHCYASNQENQQRRWRVLEGRYLDCPRLTTRQMANNEFVDVRTIQRDLRDAIEDMTVRLFGIDGLKSIA